MRKLFLILAVMFITGCIPSSVVDMFNNNQKSMKILADAPEEQIAGSAPTIKTNAKKVDAKMGELRLAYDIPYTEQFNSNNPQDDFLNIEYDISWITAEKDNLISLLIKLIVGVTTGAVTFGTAITLIGKYLLKKKSSIISNIIKGGLKIREKVKSGETINEETIKELYLSEQDDDLKDEIEKLVDKEKESI